MGKLILGIDGGGTKSHLALFDSAGGCVAAVACGPLNHEVMKGAFAELKVRLDEAISGALENIGMCKGDLAYTVLGLAGVDTNAQHRIISDILRDIGIERFGLYNDAFLGVAAGCPGGVGICAINGTGSKMAALDHSGYDVHICGLSELSDDFGGGGWYWTRVLSTVYSELFKLGKHTAMREMVFDYAGITRKEDYVEILTEMLDNRTFDRVAVNSILFNAAEAGDSVAMGVLESSALHYAGGIAYLATDMDFPEDRTLHITLAGSVFVKQRVKILPRLIDLRVREALGGRPIEFLLLEAPPVAGAVLWAAQKAGCDIDMPTIRKGLKALG